MQYRENSKNGDRLSALAFGCMRFPKDDREVERLVDFAIQSGINYFDTAYIYAGNEAVLGRTLKKLGKRDRVNIATKLPAYMVRKPEDFERYFGAELERLQTGYIDYYLCHMLTGLKDWEKLLRLGLTDFIEEKKKSGKIKNFGFSFHGGGEDFISLIDAYDWDFCMIQYNYMDEHNQAGKRGLRYAYERGIPVMIMEPLRGGRLVNALPKEAVEVFGEANKERTPADWALRWVLAQPEVTTVLSGMNTMEMLEENIKVATEVTPNSLSEEEQETYTLVKDIITRTAGVPCTGCGYCLPCPFGVDIPMCFSSYNDIALDGKLQAQYRYVTRAKDHYASQCTECGKCESHCPQSIPIRSELKRVKKSLESGIFRPFRFIWSRMAQGKK